MTSSKLELLDIGHVDAEVLQLIDLLEARYLLGARFLLPFLYLGGLSFLLGRGRLLLPECIRTSKRFINLHTCYLRASFPAVRGGTYCFLTDRDIVDGLVDRRREDYLVLLTRKWCLPVGGR